MSMVFEASNRSYCTIFMLFTVWLHELAAPLNWAIVLVALAFDIARPWFGARARAVDSAACFPRLYRPNSPAWIYVGICALFTLAALFMPFACFPTLNALLDQWFGYAAGRFQNLGGACVTRNANVVYFFHVALPFLMFYGVAHTSHIADYYGNKLYIIDNTSEYRLNRIKAYGYPFYVMMPMLIMVTIYLPIDNPGPARAPSNAINHVLDFAIFTMWGALSLMLLLLFFVACSIIKHRRTTT